MGVWVIGNWKQNPASSDEVTKLLQAISVQWTDINTTATCQLMVAPSDVHMALASQQLKLTNKPVCQEKQVGQDNIKHQVAHADVLLAAQNVSAHSATTGAFTGDSSAAQLANLGVTWTLVGHSERRLYHNETNDVLQQKISHAFSQGLGVILCVGESQAQRDNEQTHEVLQQQLSVIQAVIENEENEHDGSNQSNTNTDGNIKTKTPLTKVIDNLAERLIIAYEPVWAIGTGKTPSVEQVATLHQHIKQVLSGYRCSLDTVPVIYGGSVNANNAAQFADCADIAGALVGGASLQAQSFVAIAQAFATKKC